MEALLEAALVEEDAWRVVVEVMSLLQISNVL
jgi:hypothetical protein